VSRAQFTSPARREYLTEIAYYTSIEPSLGARFAESVEAAVARAVAFPRAGSPSASDTRQLLVQGFPFSLVYREETGGIVILAIAHLARLPEYWQPRVQEATGHPLIRIAG
jgi:plasmid stabilization system protein ParE